MNYDVFSYRLKQLRITNNLTLLQLGNHIGSTKATISNLENGNKKPSLEIILALAGYFNVSLDYLVGLTNELNIINNKTNNNHQTYTQEEVELLEDFRLLNKHEQNIIIGKISEMIYNKIVEENNNNLEVSEEILNAELIDRLNK